MIAVWKILNAILEAVWKKLKSCNFFMVSGQTKPIVQILLSSDTW